MSRSLIVSFVLLSAGCELINQPDRSANAKSVIEQQQKPNIVVIFADDLGYGDIESFGAEGIRTPNIDKIGEEGFVSRDFFIPANVCSPSRASLLTGRYPMRNGIPVAKNPMSHKHIDSHFGLHPDEITIPEMLKPAGYKSLMVGKWHLGLKEKGSHPLDAGFDEYVGLEGNFYKAPKNSVKYPYLKENDDLYRGRTISEVDIDLEKVTEIYTNEVVSFIEREKDGPFFVYFAHNIVHSPHRPSKQFKGTSEKGRYGDFIHEMDYSTGRVLKALKDHGLEDNTLVIFTSDNGANFAGSNGELNGRKYTTMEGGHIVPALFKWPGVIPAGQDSSITMTSMDIFPILAEIAGAELPSDRKLDGVNTLNILRGKSLNSPHDVLYYYNGTNLQAIRKGRWKLHLPRTIADQPFWHENSSGGRVHTEVAQNMLFDLKTDRGEKVDVANLHPDIVASFDADIQYAREELGDVHQIGRDQRVPPMENPQKIDRWWVKKKKKYFDNI
nr:MULTISPECIES: sulfatase [unclassified Psychrosphaera]